MHLIIFSAVKIIIYTFVYVQGAARARTMCLLLHIGYVHNQNSNQSDELKFVHSQIWMHLRKI